MIHDYRNFVPQSIFKTYGDRSSIFVDKRILEIYIVLKDKYKIAPTINNYHLGGQLQNRGFRIPTSIVGALFSQHKFGRAEDFNISGWKSKDLWNDIISNPQFLIDVGCTTIEDINFTPTWVHLDCRNLDKIITELLVVKP